MHIANVMKKIYKIFILEDSAVQREQISEVLKQDNRKLIFANSIKQAKKIYNSNCSDIDLFIIDPILPDGFGLDFLKYVKKSSYFTPAIIDSSFISYNIKNNIEELGIVASFEKPYELNELSQTIMNLFHYENYDKTQVMMRK